MTKEETIKYVIDSITEKFGYDKNVYFPKERYDEGYEDAYMKFCNELSLVTFNWNATDENQIVLFNFSVTYQGKNQWYDEYFHLDLKFGHPKYHSFEGLCDDVRQYGRLRGHGDIEKEFENIVRFRYNMLPKYHSTIRDKKIDSILELC
jgi:hypothetical protein